MNEDSAVKFKKHNETWISAGEKESKFRHTNAEGLTCPGRDFQTKATETTGSLGTVRCRTCGQEMAGTELGLTKANGA